MTYERRCSHCGEVLVKRKREAKQLFEKRKYCNREHYFAHRNSMAEQSTMTEYEAGTEVAVDLRSASLFESLTPLEFMLREMNYTLNDSNYRKEMAKLAAPFCHAKKGATNSHKAGEGKKATAAKEASKVAGRFASTPPPLSVVGRK